VTPRRRAICGTVFGSAEAALSTCQRAWDLTDGCGDGVGVAAQLPRALIDISNNDARGVEAGKAHDEWGRSSTRLEQASAKLKNLLRKTAKRTIEDTWRQIGTLLSHFSPQECANYFRNAGYASI
jgi:hypothetical protein